MSAASIPVLLVAVLLLLLAILFVLVGRRRSRDPVARLRKASRELISNIVIPDGEGGQIHIEYALLCPRGIVILNIKDVAGNIFGSDRMSEWAVISEKKRYGINNPQPGLFDRTAATKRLLPDLPVHGYIAFTANAKFTKGIPSHVVQFDDLVAELEKELISQPAALEAFWPGWEKLKKQAVAA